MSEAKILDDDSRPSRLDRGLAKIEAALNLIGGIVVLMLMCLAVVQVLGRKIFNAPVPGFIDWVEQFMVIFAFLGIAWCQRTGGHIRMDILITKLSQRGYWWAEMFSCAVILVLTTGLIYGTWHHFERAYSIGDSSIDISLPLWPAKLLVPVALSVLWLRLALQVVCYARAILGHTDQAYGVPLPLDASQQAEAESQLVRDDTA